ncbi:Imidazoleglycerol-phosphate dehydratase [Seminavis robusta]|uniref:Imidazoleglycerol-phosphate dehydratase n=1 Tax=Seminavis robusta TaxID=568900 RepID=A0A9N8HKP7_9STRA|nr:Imidazoleglycerol-phosphate dehydratase [Seminavis robusta]|eukprot:Sro770_g199970.1 Imidazoleglycerol-phosphate dehydratase (538) ;mRNA; r:22594-24207
MASSSTIRSNSVTSSFTTTKVACVDLKKVPEPIHTGIGFLDHMMDQLNSHAQIGVGLTVHHHSDLSNLSGTKHKKTNNNNNNNGDDQKMEANNSNNNDKDSFEKNPNRLSQSDQTSLLRHVGWTLGCQVALLNKFLSLSDDTTATSRFCCPLDEALVECILTKPAKTTTTTTTTTQQKTAEEEDPSEGSSNKRRKLDHKNNTTDKKETTTTTTTSSKPIGSLVQYQLAPFGKYPKTTGRTKIGHLETAAIKAFWEAFAKSSGLQISLTKLRGDNGHHIVESTFKAFSRAMRNLLDGTNTTMAGGESFPHMWGKSSKNQKDSIALARVGSISRATKETNIDVSLKLNGTSEATSIHTGIGTLDEFFTILAKEADMSLVIDCKGDLWVDDHHTAEDVAIAVGQVLTQALGTKAGLNRMWCAKQTVNNTTNNEEETIEVTMDLSNRPCLTHNLALGEVQEELVGDLSVEMFDHVLDSLVVNGRMTVHIVRTTGGDDAGNSSLKDRAMATAAAFGRALKYCAMVDSRRAGKTASSKGTLSV